MGGYRYWRTGGWGDTGTRGRVGGVIQVLEDGWVWGCRVLGGRVGWGDTGNGGRVGCNTGAGDWGKVCDRYCGTGWVASDTAIRERCVYGGGWGGGEGCVCDTCTWGRELGRGGGGGGRQWYWWTGRCGGGAEARSR